MTRQLNLPEALLRQYPLISDQVSPIELRMVLRELVQTLDRRVPGDIVEFGCYRGTTSLFIRRVLDAREESSTRRFHAYDSFAGLPPKVRADENAAGVDFKAGELFVSKKQFLQEFQRAKVRPPLTYKGWFNELLPADIPEQIAFAFLDGDFYDSILSSLKLVWPKMAAGGMVLIHDYKRETLPGVERAINDYFQNGAPGLRSEATTAIIQA